MGYGGDSDSGRKRKASASLVDDAAMEDEDIEDDEDGEEVEEDDDEEGGRRSAATRKSRCVFIDEEVVVTDTDDEYSEPEEDGDYSEGELPPEGVETMSKPSLYRRIEADRDDLLEDEARLEAAIKDRYASMDYVTDVTSANQQSLVPTHLDPKLWVIQCRPGFERSLCLQLLNKSMTFRKKGTPLLIKSAVSLDHLKGYLYVEAEKEAHVREAVGGMRHVQHTKGIKLVPLEEMVAAITPNRVAKLPVEVGSWVRVRSGPYAHDLAKVIRLHHAQQKVDLKVVPRIDYAELVNRQEGRYSSRNRDPFGKKAKVRPIAKPFSSEECRSLGLMVEARRGVDGEVHMAVGNYMFQDGYLIKTMSTRSIIVEDSAPPIEELHRFDAAAQMNTDVNSSMDGLPEMLESVSGKKHGLFKGDSVRVLNGDMINMTGIVTDIAADGKISVKMDSQDIKGFIPFTASELVKNFELGDHVCVREGMRRGQLGMVIKLQERKCLILADMDKSEFWAAARDLSKTEETSFGYDQFGDYEVEDLVELQHRQFGVIVFADRDFCTILLAAGSPEKPELKKATQQEIKSKCEVRRSATSDVYGNRITAGDIVDFYMGSAKDKISGTVKYVSPPYLFVKVRGRTTNLGYVALSSKLCTVRGGQRTAPPSDSGSRFASLQSPSRDQPDAWRGGYQERDPFGGYSGRGRLFLRGRGRGGGSQRENIMVKVTRGAHRGYRGRIKDETSTHVRVELDAGSKIVTVPKNNVECLDMNQGSFGMTNSNFPSNLGGYAQDGEGLYSGPPKTPYGDNHPPTTPYLSGGREILTSPKYTPVRSAPAAEPEAAPKDDDSDDDFCFGDTQPAAPKPMESRKKPSSPVAPSSPKMHESPPPPTTTNDPPVPAPVAVHGSADLASLSSAQIKDLIVLLSTGSLGVTRDVSETGLCQIEFASMKEGVEERSFHPTGEKQRQQLSSLKLLKPQVGDWVRVLDGMFVDSVGQIVTINSEDGSCITHLDDDQIQMFANHLVAVTLPPNPPS